MVREIHRGVLASPPITPLAPLGTGPLGAFVSLSPLAGLAAETGDVELGLSAWHLWFVVCEVAVQLAVVCFILVRRKRKPSVNLAWVLLILALPILGMLTYFLFGEARLGVLRRRRHAEYVAKVRHRPSPHAQLGLYPPIAEELRSNVELVESVGGMPARGGNEVRLMGDTDEVIDALVADIDAARQHCHLLFYIFLCDDTGRRVVDALIAAATREVDCRLLVDAVGSRPFLGSIERQRLIDSGVRVVAALPAGIARMACSRIDLRNHRKLVVIDGVIGYTGSQNISDAAFHHKPRFGPWVDAMLRLRGPVVPDLQELFIEDWYLDTGESLLDVHALAPPVVKDGVVVQIIPTGPSDSHEALRLISQSAFHLAREEIIVTTPYFVPGEAEVVALCTAARRGVATILVVPQNNDSPLVAAASRSLYQELLDAGVQIHEFTSGLLHAKTMTIDRRMAMLGTANFDRRSFELNFEVSALVYDSDFASRLRFLQRSYMHESTRVLRDTWPRRPWHRRLRENAAGMLSPLL